MTKFSKHISTLSQSQQLILASALMTLKGKPGSPSNPGLVSEEGNNIPYNHSDSNLVGMASICSRSSADSVGTIRHSGRTIRKSYSCGETMKIKEHQSVQLEVPPKKKYTKRFEKIFRSVVGEETLYNCYSCTLYQDSIATGHLYLTLGWFCFYSNFMGRQRQISIDVSRIESITQQRTAKIIPNAIKITTDNTSYLFSSFISRDRVYRTLITVWRNCREAQAQLSSDDSDLSDVESMTRIANFSGYADEQSPKEASLFEDSTSERSISCTGLNACAEREATAPSVVNLSAPLDSPNLEEDTADSTPSSADSSECITADSARLNQMIWKPWTTVMRSLQGVYAVMQWSGLSGSVPADEGSAIYSALIFCTGLLIAMTLYLTLRMFIFEREQIDYMLQRHPNQHTLDIHYRVDATLELNHRLLLRLMDVLSSLHKLIQNTSSDLCT
ncbi:protein Aster-B-like isoform X2 [Watersipora subatra]|uniref:protein Aster-B-like isoform X2 n=1 Tax=Watersipora subatra TaxID=2589382 RepID=UPI00355C900E